MRKRKSSTGIPGLSFSWKRALGITQAKQKGVLVKTGAETTCNALILTIIYAFKSFEPIFDASVCSLLVKTGAKNCTRFWLIHINFITLQCGLKRSEALLGSNFVRNKAVQYA